MRGSSEGLNSGVRRATKKVRKRSEINTESNDPMVDGDGKKIEDTGMTKAFYNATLLGMAQSLIQSDRMEEVFKLQKGDVLIEAVDGILSITFSDRVHNLLNARCRRP